MSNPYLYNPKVLHSRETFPQMTSNEYQPPFYFGGSQVPDAFGMHPNTGSGIYNKTFKTLSGKGVKHHTLPIHLGSMMKI